MKRTVLEIYALAVCFGALICLVIALGIAVYDVVRIASPELTLDQYEYNRHQTNDAFWQSNPTTFETQAIGPGGSMYRAAGDIAGEPPKRPTEKELSKKRLASYKLALAGEVRSALQSLIRTTILVVISTILFITHWRLARRAREEATANLGAPA